ncbi:hypothetical protein [Bradyrhizobium sp. BWC-3-1]|uniref:hypothetical protein n=1 Tax=Bradyrhizobium sp. BWC-3-1 TaxID=3080012 RepID=UPI00293EBFBB|nr:hypothetical protein [Bradyrhizobium sp. BWC-3-1]WOH55039.1 hypothetical protein RX329_22195 [Bradyrhizobium sp. BWC-3-1]
MNEQFVPPGYVRLEDFDTSGSETPLRQRFASGELVAAVWDRQTGEVVDLNSTNFLADWTDNMIKERRLEKKVPHPRDRHRTETIHLPVLVKRLAATNSQPAPVPSYVSPFLEMMLTATVQFGITKDKAPPKKEELVEYFKKQRLPDGSSLSNSLAEAMATFVRPPEAMKGGNKRMGGANP